MQLTRRQEAWDPFREVEELGIRLNRRLGLNRWPRDGEREEMRLADWVPSCNVIEKDDEYHVRAELPDVAREDLHLTLDNRILTIQGERKAERDENSVKFHRRELRCGNFLRRFTMPADADESKITASFKDGILAVVIGRSKVEKAKGIEIAVH
jgi:HSP20 family protein